MRSVQAGMSGALLCLLASVASAQNAVDLEWDAPAECPQAEAVQAHVRQLAGEALETAQRPRAEGRIVRVGRRYQLTLSVYDKGGVRERTITSDTCADLAGAAAVALGLFIHQGPSSFDQPGGSATTGATTQGQRGAESGQKGAGPDTNQSANSSSSNARPSKAQPPKASSTEGDRHPEADTLDSNYSSTGSIPGALNANLFVRAPLLVTDAGPMPKPGLALGGALGIHSGGFRIAVGGRVFLAQTWLVAGSADVGANVHRWQADLWLCKGWRTGRTELSPCLTAGLDGLSATGSGPGVTPSSQKSLSVLLGGAATAHFHVFENMAILAGFGVGIETSRPILVIEGIGPIEQLGPVQISFSLGPEWIF